MLGSLFDGDDEVVDLGNLFEGTDVSSGSIATDIKSSTNFVGLLNQFNFLLLSLLFLEVQLVILTPYYKLFS